MRKFLLRPSFAMFWGSHTVSSIGTWMDYVVLNLYVYELFGSASVLGSFLVVRLLPTLVFAPLGGWLADRYARKTLLVACDLIRAILILGYVVVQDMTWFFILGVVLASFDRVYQAVQGAFIPDIVAREELLEANGLMRMGTSVTTVIGPALGAMLVSSVGFVSAFMVDALSFVVSALFTLFVRAEFACSKEKAPVSPQEPLPESQLTPSVAQASAPTPATAETVSQPSGFRLAAAFLLGSPLMAYLFLVRLVDSLGGGTYMTGLPVVCMQSAFGGKESYGWLIGVWALGTLLGSFGVARFCGRDKVPVASGFALAVLVMSVGMGATFWASGLALAMLCIFVGGLGDGLSGLLFQTHLMKTAPAEVRGRVIGTSLAALQGASAVGMAAAGPILASLSVEILTAVASLVVGMAALVGLAILGGLSPKRDVLTR